MSEPREVDLVINGGTVVTASGPRRAGVAVDGGRIVAVAEDEHLPPSRDTYDATGMHVIPGLVDTEAHPGCYSPLKDDLATRVARRRDRRRDHLGSPRPLDPHGTSRLRRVRAAG